MASDTILYVLALAVFAADTFGLIKNINGTALGLTLLTLSLLV